MQKYIVPIVLAAFVVVMVLFLANSKLNPVSNQGVISNTEGGEALTVEEQKTILVKMSNKEILTTNGVRHTVPLDEIVGGGPVKDGIPSIDDPFFVSVEEAQKFLSDSEPGIAYSNGDTNRFYPFYILVWHEIVNDHVNGKRILVSYCPLCLTASVFDPIVNGERVEFGTSGKLWQSNLVMYDRKTDTYWSQVLGEAIKGELAGTKLSLLPSDQMRFGNWKKQFPNGEVLSTNTGELKFYGSNPYGDYFRAQDFTSFMVNNSNDALARDTFVFGLEVDGKFKAYNTESIKKIGELTDLFNDKTFVLQYDKDLDVIRVYEKLSNGDLNRINPISGFWFSWVAVHPDTELYK